MMHGSDRTLCGWIFGVGVVGATVPVVVGNAIVGGTVDAHVASALDWVRVWIGACAVVAGGSWLGLRVRGEEDMDRSSRTDYAVATLTPMRFALRGPQGAGERERLIGWFVLGLAALVVLAAPREWWPRGAVEHREAVAASLVAVAFAFGCAAMMVECAGGLPGALGVLLASPGIAAYWLRDASLVLIGVAMLGFAGAAGVALAGTTFG